ncbi:unnamed protein product [Adineta steineri]|uniref:DUF1275 domain-containing protein n=1 Tax=Adineta steineri TaxID=433720 RepID=A0A814Q8A8_9BILA|nr:unnamed protein product [Adineta steineri]CAF3733941.1 unnamed protein product [Adineta steineri]
MRKLSRRPTIISPTGHIQSYDVLHFSALVATGCLLSFIAGYVNTICIIGFFQTPVSAFTGATSKMIIELGKGNFNMTLHFFLMIFSFVLGSFISAAVVGGSSFRINRSYGLVLLLESFALALSYLFEKTTLTFRESFVSLQVGAYLMSLAFGLQNGMCTTFSGAVIRTTHVTGTLTDIGLIVGQAIFYPRTRKHIWKLKVLLPIYSGFCLGGLTGYFVYQLLLIKAIFLPCTIVGILGIAQLFYSKIILVYNAKHITNKKDWTKMNINELSATKPQIESYMNNNCDIDEHISLQDISIRDEKVNTTAVL